MSAAIDVSPRTRRAFISSGGHVQNGHVTNELALRGSHVRFEAGRRGDRGSESKEGEESMGEESDDECTAGDLDTVPYESTTTDTIPEHVEPIDFIESKPRSYSESALPPDNGCPRIGGAPESGGFHRYENWNLMIDDSSRRGRVIKRWKASRVSQKERQRAPYPLPRQTHVKSKIPHAHPRPSPASRKRRFSGRVPRPPRSNASEGDMAQADEMGEGKDDGFVDCPEGQRRRNKKRQGAVHMFLPTVGSSPPSSPSNTPISRRRMSSRKSRPKPRLKKHTKQPMPASADVSTQETTTPGPGSSDTTDESISHEESQPHLTEEPAGDSESDALYDDARSGTPNFQSPSSATTELTRQHDECDVGFAVVEHKNVPLSSGRFPPALPKKKPSSPERLNQVHPTSDDLRSNSEENLHRDSSDTDLTSLSYPASPPIISRHALKRLESDFSTAPLSSETSDLETSGNERAQTDGGSTCDLTNLKAVDQSSSFTSEASSIKSESRPKVEGKPVLKPLVSKKGNIPTKRPLQPSTSNPLVNPKAPTETKTSGQSSNMTPSASATNLTKPKPPLAAKPGRPEVRPKPVYLSSSELSQLGKSPQQRSPTQSLTGAPSRSEGDLLNKTQSEVNLRKQHSGESNSPGPLVRKTLSDTDLRSKGARSPSAAVKRLTKLYEEKEEGGEALESISSESSKQSVTTTPPPTKPAVPIKPRRQGSDKKIHLVTPESSNLKDVNTSSDSSKTPSSSETPPSHNQSPSISPTPSPASRKKPVPAQKPQPAPKPSVPPKKPGLIHQSFSASDVTATKNGPNPKGYKKHHIEGGGSKPVLRPKPTQLSKEPIVPYFQLRVDDLKQAGNKSPVASSPPNDSEEPAPPVPPRKSNRRSTHIELVIPASEDNREQPRMALGPKSNVSSHRRPPPSPPSPRRDVNITGGDRKRTTIARGSEVQRRVRPSGPSSPKRHSMFSTNLSSTQINSISENYETCELSLDFREPLSEAATEPPTRPKKPPRFRVRSPDQRYVDDPSKYPRSKTPDSLMLSSRNQSIVPDTKKGSDSELEMVSSAKRRQTSGSSKKIRPPKPPKYSTPDATTTPEPIPNTTAPPQPRLPSNDLFTAPREDTPPPLPTQPIPKKKDRMTRQQTCNSDQRREGSPSLLQGIGEPPSSESLEQTHTPDEEPLYDIIGDGCPIAALKNQKDKDRSPMRSLKKLFKARSAEESDRSSPELPPRKSFSSSLMYRRSSSDRFKQKVSTLDAGLTNGLSTNVLQRTPSLDKLDARMDRSLKGSLHNTDPLESSSDDDEEVSTSPIERGLPKPPTSSFTPGRGRAMKSLSAFISADDEPLYQYINTAEFLSSRQVVAKFQGPNKSQLDIARQLSQRRLWCELPEVIGSGALMSLNEEEKKLQEAMFEVITSEATYLRSLDVLIEHFMSDPGMNPNLPDGRRVLDKRQHHVIFSNVREIRDVSARFLEELQKRQRESAVVRNISDIILNHSEHKFDCYVSYCTNQVYQTRELQECFENNVMFREYLKRLESHKRCQNLSMQSFLLLPMQRITRMPLLILAILNRTPLNHPDHQIVEQTLRTVQKLVTSCNDGARKMDRTEQLHNIHQRMDFGKLKPFALVSASRQLERKGTLIRLRVEQKLFGKNRIRKTPVHLFAFTDYLVITKKKKDPKGEDVYRVVDHCSRALIEVEDIGSHPGVTFPKHVFGEQEMVAMATWAVSSANVKHAFLVILLDNASHTSEKYLLVAQNTTDKTRWMESISRPEVHKEEEKIYQHWDCPQVQAIYDYQGEQPDELSLERGDVIKVYRKMADGWYEGERLRDLQWGWFPSNFTVEIENEHTRARNLRETHKLLSLQLNPEEFTARMQNMN